MALWQVKFVMLPTDLLGDCDEVPEKTFLSYVEEVGGPHPEFGLPAEYGAQVAEILPSKKSWAPDLEIWGTEASDDVQIWSEEGKITSIGVRIDVRKLDNALLSRLLTLAERWSCVLVETRYRRVCRMGVEQFRGLVAGHPHSRAMKDPAAWLPILADEVKRSEERS